jgi:hypothetical protein
MTRPDKGRRARPRRATDSDELGTLERVKVQAAWNRAYRLRSVEHPASLRLTKINRDDELLLIFPDGNRHERRIQRAVSSDSDRLFWATIAVACGAPPRSGGQNRYATLAKEYGTLKKARHDLDAFYEYYRPMQIGDPRVIAPSGVGKSSGYFDFTARLDNPTVSQLETSIVQTSRWISVNQEDPEYSSVQLNFCFSGHGDVTSEESPNIVLADAELDARELASMLLRAVPQSERVAESSRIDLYLDCCRGGPLPDPSPDTCPTCSQPLIAHTSRSARSTAPVWMMRNRSSFARCRTACSPTRS